VLIPFLTGKPLETSLWETEVAADANEDPGAFGEWASPQRSDTAYVRCLFHAIRHMLKSKGMDILQTKQVLLALRAQLVSMIDNDLQFVRFAFCVFKMTFCHRTQKSNLTTLTGINCRCRYMPTTALSACVASRALS